MDLFELDSLEPVLHRKTYIVPVNLTYYPIRARENILSKLALRLVGLGLLESSNGAFRLTARGLPLADAVAREFLDLAR